MFSNLRISSDDALYLYQVAILIITNGHNFIKTVNAVTFLVLCIMSNYGLQLYQVSQKYLEPF